MSTPENAEVPPTEGQNNKPEIEITTADDRLARQIVEVMVEKGIKVLALDFDKTIIAIHTAGFWTEPTAKLAEYVRPCFKALIKAALDTRLHLCIVTYSMQPALISDLIHMVLPNCDTRRILIRANSKDWLPRQTASSQYGKQQHIAWIVTELFNKKHAIIHPEEILLMDDDNENVDIAHQFGHQAYEVPEMVTLEDISRFVENMQFIRHVIPPT